MKSPIKFFFRRNKKNQSLLADVDSKKVAYDDEIEEEGGEQIDARDETIADRNKMYAYMPYQIATTSSMLNNSYHTKSLSHRSYPEKVTFHEDEWDQEVIKPKINKESGDTTNVIQGKGIRLPASESSTSDDIFDDLESVFEEIGEDDKFLSDFLGERSVLAGSVEDSKEKSDHPKSLNGSLKSIDVCSSYDSDIDQSTENLLNTLTSPASTGHLAKMTRGMLIVDPNKNGIVYHMDDDNKSLTDKDLIIIGHTNSGEPEGGYDDATVMSNLTEVSYQKSKEERVKFIVQHLKDATIRKNSPFCAILNCEPSIDNDTFGDVIEDDNEGKIKKAVEATERQFSITADSGALLQTLIGSKVDYGSFDEKVIVCITRIYLALMEGGNDNGLRCTHNEPKLSHDFGVRLVEDHDGQALVASVIAKSSAERAGVQIGDKLSFSVPLNNTFQGYERACEFISRLEAIGMRTSYRELFEMFLSKTSSGWPVAIVFRRQSEGMLKAKRLPFGLQSMDMNIDILRAATCLHELITSCREFDYVLEANGIDEVVRGNIESFIPRPRCMNRKANISLHLEPQYYRMPFVPSCRNSSITNIHEVLFSREFRRSSLLTWYVENSTAILYMKITNCKGGSGLIEARTNTGSWSAPCSISSSLNFETTQITEAIDCFIFWRQYEDVQKFLASKTMIIDMEENENANFMVLTKVSDVFYVETRMKCIIKTREEINQMMYSKDNEPDAIKILGGKIPYPDQGNSLFGALRRVEFPSTMYPHPTPPINLSRYTSHKWERRSSCMPSELLEQPFDEEGLITLRAFLRIIERSPKFYREDKSEIDNFMLNFNRMLFDGVTVERTWISMKGTNTSEQDKVPSKALMKLWHMPEESWELASLQFTSRANVAENEGSPHLPPDFRYPFQSEAMIAECFKVDDISSISKTMPDEILLPSKQRISDEEMKKRQKRFLSFEMNDGTQVMFFARTGKDAALLSCGLKLLIERVQINL